MTVNHIIKLDIHWVNNIPASWKMKRLKNCGSFKSGSDYKHLLEGNIPLFGSSELPFAFVNKSICNKRAIAVGRKGTIDKPFILPNSFWAVDTCLYNTVSNKSWNLEYVYYWMKIIPFKDIGSKTAIPSLTQTQVNNVFIAQPPLNKQIAISKYLDHQTVKIDNEISLLEKKSNLLEEYKQSLIFETVTKGLDKNAEMKDSGIDWIGKIPKNWTVNRLKDKLNIQKGSVFTDDLIDDEGIYPYINGGVKPSGWTNAFNCIEKTIAVSEGGASSGYSQYMETKFWAGSHCYKITPKKNENSKYYYYLFKGFEKEIQYAKTGSAMPNLQKSKFTNLIFSFTSNLYEQNSIVEYLDLKTKKIENEVKLINKKIELLKEYKQSLIYEAVTGQLDIE